MTCDELRARHLAGEASESLGSHLAGCPACRTQLPAIDRLRLFLADPVTWEAPGPNLERLVIDEVSRQQTPPVSGGRRKLNAFIAAAVAVTIVAAVVVGSLLRRPDWSTVLVASEHAPSATASVAGWLTAEGTRMRFVVAGLPSAGPDKYYEIWLTATDGTHVSAGSFQQAGTIETSIGVARAEYPRVWITLEPIDDDLGPSGVTVLDDPDA